MSPADQRLNRLQSLLHRDIPLAAALGATVLGYDGTRLSMGAPFQPNRNGHHTAFAGSLTARLTMAGWGLVHLMLGEAGWDAAALEVVLQEGTTRFDRSVVDSLTAVAMRPPEEELERFFATLRRRGRARVQIFAEVRDGGVPAVSFRGKYVAWLGALPRVGGQSRMQDDGRRDDARRRNDQ